ncbi:putative dual specificity protein phosphatase [Trypanosoma cruzi]|uniref:protein-tyrosine-phosphatase n=2 Tax=Trypanosoma cruzi TaxID=5693 RepID=Q4DBZ0_TRYCC|nr:dual specificity protein phosphatase, putative [Trypanosoma cruzi]EAN90043.1 dual specificity protein phosphatase, putative [Trypanosoma cruzi]PWV15959.1 putative dual specificity protein phosphatase [Trypanosoma cruzi]RNC55994.1 putative dual specificity protein phosphatase [Trypanosoma cruzi]|eukprot:XP_811894.1 dual specificity protein phosphatase [Trypanosoma cruzi strain CL Brener]
MSLMPADGGEGVGPPGEGNQQQQQQQQPPRPQQQRCCNKQKNREEEGENCEEEETFPLEASGSAPASNTSTDVSGAQGLTACKEEGSGDMTATKTTTKTTAAVVNVVDTNAGRSQQNGIVAPARSGVTEYTCSGRSSSSSVGSSAHVSPSRFVVGSTRHISFTTKPPAPGNGARVSSVSLSNSQMQAVIKFVSCRASGDKKQIVTQASVPGRQSPLQMPGNDTSASTARASVDVTPMPTPSLPLQGQSSKGQMASLSAIDLPVPHVSLRQCTSTPVVPKTVGTQPHSCYEKEEERDYFLQKVTPQLHRMLPLWRKNFGKEMVTEEGMTATATATEAKAEAECQQEQRQEKILSENDITDRRLRQRLPEASSQLHIRLPVSPMCNAANSAYNPGSSDFDVSVSSSSSSSRTLSTLQASSHHIVRSVCHVLTGTPTFSSCNVSHEENETEKTFGISKAQTTTTTTTTTTTKATTMTIGGGGGGGGGGSSSSNSRSDGFVLTSHEQNDCICGVQARGIAEPVEFVQENSTRQVLTKNGNRSGVFTPSPLPPLPPLSHGACSSYSLDAAMVLPGLFLGSYSDALKIDALAAHGISLVINVAEECVMMETMIYNDYDIKFIKFPLKDHSDENITRYFGPITRIIHQQLHRRERALRSSRKTTGNIRSYDGEEVMSIPNKSVGGGVLVHCRMGVSRSAAIILAYLMIYGETLWVDDNCSIQNQHMEEESFTPIFTPPNVSPISTLLLDGSDVEKESHSTNGKCCECCCCLAIQNPHITCNTGGVYTPSVVKSYRDAFEFLKKRKKDINPNIGFVLALRELDDRDGK